MSSSIYDRAAAGVSKALKFKGEDPDKTRKEKKKEKKRKREHEKGEKRESGDDREEEVPVVEGQGRIVSSGTTVHGFETKFQEQLAAGDQIMVHHPTTLQVENRIVVGVLSQRSCTIHAPFSSDLVSTSGYHVKKDSIVLKKKAEKKAMKKEEGEVNREEEEEKLLQDEISKRLQKQLKKTKSTLTYQTKTGFSYKQVSETLDKEYSKEQLLDMRVKKSRDKFCWV
eukprot:GDKI01025445.1.p1 GENE.GDKI01025445.1~~GDKI01025445.1.p1  ORF type:complete len:226 (+),score=94.06 GDKI01025445.1:67-744(+)